MANVLIEESSLHDIADNIRLNGINKEFKPSEMAQGVLDACNNALAIGESMGYQQGQAEGYIQGKTDGINEEHSAGYEEGYGSGYDSGKQDTEELWDIILTNATNKNIGTYTNDRITILGGTAFSMSYVVRDELNFPNVQKVGDYALQAVGMSYQYARNLKISLPKATYVGMYAFATSPVTTLDLSSLKTHGANAFVECVNLKNLILGTNCITKSFYLPSSRNLTDESIQNVINALADLTGTTSQTLYLHSTMLSKLTDEQLATISAKNWTVA